MPVETTSPVQEIELWQTRPEIKFKKREFDDTESKKVIELLADLPPERNAELEPYRRIINNADLSKEQRTEAREILGSKGLKYCNGIGLVRSEIRSIFASLPEEKVANACSSITELMVNAVIHSHDNTVKITVSSDGSIALESANLFEDAKIQIPKLAESHQRLKDSLKPVKPESEMTDKEKHAMAEQEKEEGSKPGGRGFDMVIGLTDQIIYDVDTGHGTGRMELRYNVPEQPHDVLIFRNKGREIGHLSKLDESNMELAA